MITEMKIFDPIALRAALCFLFWAVVAGSSGLFAQAPDRSKPPAVGPARSLKLPAIQHFKLSNGLQVILMEKHEVPLVQIEMIALAGAAADPAGLSGLAGMTVAMMEEGAGTRNALELADAIDFLGASITTFAGQHTTGVVMHSPLSKLDSALALLGDVVLRPQFPPDELERNRRDRLTSLMQWHDDPDQIAIVQFQRTIFGSTHPYGRPTLGNEQSLRSMTVTDLKNFHKKYFRPNNAGLIVVGDLTGKDILPKLEQTFGKWEKGDPVEVTFAPAAQIEKREIYLVDKPGAPQSVIRIGRVGAQRLTEDYFPLVVMNTILGGSFTSRLNQNLRETHGYTYGAGSGFDFLPTPGTFRAAASVQTNVTDKALVEFMKELKGILDPVSDEELTRAENYLVLRYPENFQSVSQIAGQLLDTFLYHLPDDYFNDYSSHIRAVSKDDVLRVARKYLDPEKVAIVVVGDRKQVEQGVTALGLGPLRNLTVDDVLGPAPVLQGKN